mmetsp:Transcript_19159/g.36684  ORF Transcript_19159/g.36684 Transcript_19159/m.36684 type:complete len:84 (+) Transcript_19159:97-348(+)
MCPHQSELTQERMDMRNFDTTEPVTNGITHWMQCDSSSCCKWRAVANDYFSMIEREWSASRSWYCRDHPDARINAALDPCAAP